MSLAADAAAHGGPSRPRLDLSRPGDRSALAAIGIAAVLALLIWSPSVGGPAPGDPAAVAADPRLARCGGTLEDIEYAFAIPHAREYQRYLPSVGRLSELEIDPPALVVVYREPLAGRSTTPSGGAAAPTPTPRPAAVRDICVYVGVAGQGGLSYLSNVSIAGLRATPDGPVLVPVPET